MYNINGVSIEILTDNNNIMTEYTKDGKTFIEGRVGSEYKIRLQNQTSNRVLCVVSVDGLDVVEGQPCDFNSAGYVLEPWQSYDITGWRTSNEQVRKFYFTAKQDSYSKKVGKGTQNLGVIGLAAFNEYKPWAENNWINTWSSNRYYDNGHSYRTLCSTGEVNTDSLNVVGLSTISEVVKNIGTGMGDKITDNVNSTTFNRTTVPFQKIEIFYFERRELEKMGIITKPTKQIKSLPQAFPKQFCKEI